MEHVLRICFLICMVSCAATVLLLVWEVLGEGGVGVRVAVSFFVLGLGLFLAWASCLISRAAKQYLM